MQEKRFPSLDESGLAAFARSLAPRLAPGDFLAFFGGLGAGKTSFVRALGEAMGIGDVASPTFTIVQEHDGALPLFHFDAYRLADAEELYGIGFEDYLRRGGIIAMEWSENVPEALPEARLELHLAHAGKDARSLCLRAFGTRYESLLEEYRPC